MLVGVGVLPRSLATRSLPIKMKKRHRGEPVERLRRKRFNAEAGPLRDRCAGWADAHVDDLAAAAPLLPDELSDRQQDTAEPLLAIADAVGGEWPARLRVALIELYQTAVDVEDDEPVRLLADIRTVFQAKEVTELSTDQLLDALLALEESPWHEWMSTRVADPRRSAAMKLANRLRRFEIKATRIQSGQERLRGYTRASFADAWERHLPPSGA